MENEVIDVMVQKVQIWLGTTYPDHFMYYFDDAPENGLYPIKADGKIGERTEKALIMALQLELNITVDGVFGSQTMVNFAELYEDITVQMSTKRNQVYILQGGLYCKGLNPHYFDGDYGTYTKVAVEKLQQDIGFLEEQVTGKVNASLMKALLSLDAFVLLPSGDANIRMIQQALNRGYCNYFNLIPCNGIYDKVSAKAMIYAIQVEEKKTTPQLVIDGGFGPVTLSHLPLLYKGGIVSNRQFVYILQYLLYINGFDSNGFDGGFGNGVHSAVTNFQKFAALTSDGRVGQQTWASLLISYGDRNREAKACDCNNMVTEKQLDTLENNGYEYIGRYLTGSTRLSHDEMSRIFRRNIKIIPLFERKGEGIYEFITEYYTYEQGKDDAFMAMNAALKVLMPQLSVIYFTVDYDAYDINVTNNIIPYFQGINEQLSFINPQTFRVGVYGPRNVCSRVIENGLATYAFVSDMSSGFSGNIGYKLPRTWAFDQISTITLGSGNSAITIDKDVTSVHAAGVDSFGNYQEDDKVDTQNERFKEQLSELTDYAEQYYQMKYGELRPNNINQLIAQYMRHEKYSGTAWDLTAGQIDNEFIDYVDDVSRWAEQEDIELLIDPQTGLLIEHQHFFATMNAILYRNEDWGMLDKAICDLAGWAGDLLTFTIDVMKEYSKDPSMGVYGIAYKLIGAKTTSFSLNDLLQDIDAYNIGRAIMEGAILNMPELIKSYYTTGYQSRYSNMLNERFLKSATTLYDEAVVYLNHKGNVVQEAISMVFAYKFDTPNYSEAQGEEIARAFAEYFFSLRSKYE